MKPPTWQSQFKPVPGYEMRFPRSLSLPRNDKRGRFPLLPPPPRNDKHFWPRCVAALSKPAGAPRYTDAHKKKKVPGWGLKNATNPSGGPQARRSGRRKKPDRPQESYASGQSPYSDSGRHGARIFSEQSNDPARLIVRLRRLGTVGIFPFQFNSDHGSW